MVWDIALGIVLGAFLLFVVIPLAILAVVGTVRALVWPAALLMGVVIVAAIVGGIGVAIWRHTYCDGSEAACWQRAGEWAFIMGPLYLIGFVSLIGFVYAAIHVVFQWHQRWGNDKTPLVRWSPVIALAITAFIASVIFLPLAITTAFGIVLLIGGVFVLADEGARARRSKSPKHSGEM